MGCVSERKDRSGLISVTLCRWAAVCGSRRVLASETSLLMRFITAARIMHAVQLDSILLPLAAGTLAGLRRVRGASIHGLLDDLRFISRETLAQKQTHGRMIRENMRARDCRLYN